MTDHPGEQFPPAVDPDVEPGADPRTDEEREPDYDSEPGSSGTWVNPTQQARPHSDPLLAGFTMYGDTPAEEPDAEPSSSYDSAPGDDFIDADDTEQAFEASLEEEPEASTELDAQVASYEDLTDEPAAEASSYEQPDAAADEVDAFGEVEAAEELTQQSAAFPTPGPSAPAFPRPGPPAAGAGSAFPRPGPPAGDAGSAFPKPAPPVRPAPAETAAAEYEGVDEDGVHPLVEETMGRLDELRERPVGEHAEVYADLHERLQSALVEADAEHGDRG